MQNGNTFRACRVSKTGGAVQAAITTMTPGQLCPGEVVIEVHYSSINYKDALAVTGRGKIMRRLPLNAGVDLAGRVLDSDDARFNRGDAVLATGCGLGESHDGGLAEMARLPADWVVPLPDGLSLLDAMTLGTAGFTAALAIDRMEQNGQRPTQGPVVVTGARGGVGSVALDLLGGRGYETVAMTRHLEAAADLKMRGAAVVINYTALLAETRPLSSAQWGGAIDSVGGAVLAGLVRSTRPWGNVASIGMAAGMDCQGSVMPFILRGVSILGISSANCPMPHRLRVWQRLVTDLRPADLAALVAGVVTLEQVPAVCEQLLRGEHQGRFVVRMPAAAG